VRINRAELSTPAELAAWQSEIQQHVELEIQYHFAAEESYIFPVALKFAELKPLVEELLKEHTELRSCFAQTTKRSLDREGLRRFAELLTSHIRKEERQLFEAMQEKLSAEELAQIGANVDRALEAASEACITPTETILKQAQE
jgi:hemerythrin-like domain-containing protein